MTVLFVILIVWSAFAIAMLVWDLVNCIHIDNERQKTVEILRNIYDQQHPGY